MFDLLRRSARHGVDTDRLRSHAADVGASLQHASSHAGQTAAQLADQARVGALQAVDWAAPRVEKALREGAKAAAPKVERAAEKAVPLVDTAHDRLVEDLLPKLVAAVGALATATATGADKARDVTSAKLTELAHLEVPEPKKSHTGAKVFWLIAGIAAVGAAIAAWRRSQPQHDPWAEQPWESAEHGADRFKHRAAEAREEVRDDLGSAAEAVGEVAGEAVARTREATEKAKEASERVAERAREATEKAKEATDKAREAAAKKAPARRRAATAGESTTGTAASTTTTTGRGTKTPSTAATTPSVGDTVEPGDASDVTDRPQP
jgi:hypothetical protein